VKKNLLPFVYLPAIVLFLIVSVPATGEKQPEKQRPLEKIQDILAWKSIRSATVSPDGEWFAYRLSPQEGDGTVVIRRTREDKVYTFPAGESSGFGRDIYFSEDSRWAAFTLYPGRAEARKLKKQKKKAYNSAVLVDLASGEKEEFKKVKSYAFSGEDSSWIALHAHPPEAGPSPGASSREKKDAWCGSDLLLRELSTGATLNIGNVSEFAFNKRGDWLAWVVDAREKAGNGVQLRSMKTGVIFPLESDRAVYSKLTWTEKGDGLAVLKGVEDEEWEDKLYSLVGFSGFGPEGAEKIVYDPRDDPDFPPEMTISPNRNPQWTEDLRAILFGIHGLEKKKEKKEEAKDEDKDGKEGGKEAEKKAEAPPRDKAEPEKEPDKEDLPDLVIWHWKDKRLQSMQQVQEKRDKNFSYLCIYRVDKRAFIRLADDEVRRVSADPRHRWAVGLDDREYEWLGNLDGRRYQDVYVINLETGERRLALKKCRWYFGPSPDGTRFLYYADGHFHAYEMATGESANITRDVPTSFIDEEDDHNVVDPPIRPYTFGWTKEGNAVLLYDNWDVWHVPVSGGRGTNLTANGKKEGIRYQRRFRLDPQEQGIDLSRPLYISTYGEWTKKSGVALVEEGKPGARMLLWDDALFSLTKAEKADTYLYTRQTYKDFPDYYVADGSLENGTRITEANPQQKEFLWSSGSMLLDYTSEEGDRLQAALFLPAAYEKGKRYPTIVYIYEKLSQRLNAYFVPSARGFNKSVYTSRGYAVLMPDIVYKVNDPGLSAVRCVLPALEASIATGVVDPERVGLHGHSWGGYQTAFLITQTDAFRAAVAGAPLTNLVSMYSSIYWNTGSANQPIFESSQGRFKGGYWENLEAYTRNSPVYFAQQVHTPLLLLHNDQDGAVDWNQGIEYFNTLRRLKKPVVMLQYKGENHGLRKPPNQKDYTLRMREFFDHHLLGRPAPAWLEQGVPHLEMEKHIKEMTKRIMGSGKEN